MAKPPLTLKLDAPTQARLEAAAAAANLSVHDYAVQAVSTALAVSEVAEATAAFEGPHDWTEANRRLAEYDRTGVSIPLEEVLSAFDDALEAALAQKR